MKRFLIVTALFFLGVAANAQETPAFRKSFSLELGAGPGPLHMLLPGVSPSRDTEVALADRGQGVSTSRAYALFLSGVLRTGYRWETVVTACVSWTRARITQYETFGIDPEGKPRYDLSKGAPAGWKNLSPIPSLTVEARVFWNPAWKVQPYSAFGVGLSCQEDKDPTAILFPLPSLVPAGVRFGNDHFYFYLQEAFTPFASLLHGGLGWRF